MQISESKHNNEPRHRLMEYSYYSLVTLIICVVFADIYVNRAITKIPTEIIHHSEQLNIANQTINVLHHHVVGLSAPVHDMLHSKKIAAEKDSLIEKHKVTLQIIDEIQLEYNNSTISYLKHLFLMETEQLKSKITSMANISLDIAYALTNKNEDTAHKMMIELDSMTRETLEILDDVNQKVLGLRAHYNTTKSSETNQLMRLHTLLLLIALFLIILSSLLAIRIFKKRTMLETERNRQTETLASANESVKATAAELSQLKIDIENADLANTYFSDNIHRETHSSLTAILNHADTLPTETQSATTNEGINSIRKSANYLLQRIDNLVDFSKLEANKLKITALETSPFDLLHNVHQTMSLQAQEKGLDLQVNYHFPLPKIIKTDPRRYQQIILNLCSNAIRFTNNGKITLNLFCPQDKQQLSISVIDSGIGMTKNQQQSIVNAGQQSDSVNTFQHNDTEPGLAFTIRLVNKLGGQVTVETARGIGSNFTVTIPVGLDNIEYVNQSPATMSVSKNNNSEKTKDRNTKDNNANFAGLVLLVEDNIDNQRLLSRLLRKAGLDVDTAENGKIAVDKAMQGHYDLILMDIQMPVMNGLEATATLRENNYQGKIVAVTANTLSTERQECFDAGCDGFLAKPVIKKKFDECLHAYLSDNIKPMDETKNNATDTPSLDKQNPSLDKQNGNKRDKESNKESNIDVTSAAIDDPQFTSELLESDPDIIALLEDYLQRLPAMIQDIQLAYEAQNWVTMQKQAHDLKSTSGLFGLNPLSELANAIVTNLRSDTYHDLLSMVQDMSIISQKTKTNVDKQIQHYKNVV